MASRASILGRDGNRPARRGPLPLDVGTVVRAPFSCGETDPARSLRYKPDVPPDKTVKVESKDDGDEHTIHLWTTPLP